MAMSAQQPPTAMKQVLIVEDHADIRRLIRMTLEFEDCEIHEAADAAAGLALARRLRPDVVLADVMMPGALDGLELCRAVKTDPALAGVAVVILSARGSSADREAGLKAGANAYLVKPFSPMQLLELLGTLAAVA
jgi:CheY-like chemotaxis protein